LGLDEQKNLVQLARIFNNKSFFLNVTLLTETGLLLNLPGAVVARDKLFFRVGAILIRAIAERQYKRVYKQSWKAQ
jgi:hypothetical protein